VSNPDSGVKGYEAAGPLELRFYIERAMKQATEMSELHGLSGWEGGHAPALFVT